MSLLQGFASVNTDEPAAGQQAQTLEAREARAISLYEQTLALIQAQQAGQAEAALRALLEEPVVAECATDQLLRVKFLALKNLGDLLSRRGPLGIPAALAAYCQATEVVGDDAGLWNRLGTLASEAGYWAAARGAFERGLELDPGHPTLPDKLLQLLLHLGDGGAAATLAAALRRSQPRHGLAAAVARAAEQGTPLPALSAGLLTLPPAGAGAPPPRPQQQHLERPRTLEQPCWQQLLHHSLLFLSSNRLAEGGGQPATPTAAAADPAAAGQRSPGPSRRHVPSLVRFTYRRAPQPAAAAAAAAAAAGGATAPGGPSPAASPPPPAASDGGSAAPSPSPAAEARPGGMSAPPSGSPAASAPPSPTPPALAGASPAAAAQPGSPPEATPAAAAPAPSPAGGSLSPLPPESAGRGAGEGQEQEAAAQPDGGAGGATRKAVGRATRSRAASGQATPLAALGQGGGPEAEAAELLGMLGSLVSAPQQGQAGGAALSPLLPSESRGVGPAGRPAAGGLPAGPADGQAGEQEAAAVKEFLRQLPQQGIGRRELATRLLRALCGEPAAAAALVPAARQELLQLAHAAQHDVADLPPATCLLLGELFVDAAAAAARERARGAGPWQAAAAGRRPSGARGRRSDLSLEQLQQSGALWLMRHRLSTAEACEAAGQPAAAASHGGEAAAPQQQRQQAEQAARLWWALGRLGEAGGGVEAAAAAYSNCAACLGAFEEGASIALPHCACDAAVSMAAVRDKQEALRLHGVLAAAAAAAATGDLASVAAALAPLLLSCTDKELQLQQLHHAQWLQGMQLLLQSAAGGGGDASLALRCHLRLLSVLLPPLPPATAATVGGTHGRVEGAAATPLAPLSQLASVAEQLAATPAATAALEAAAAFLQELPADAAVCWREAAGAQAHLALRPEEQPLYAAVQRQLAAAVAGCAAAVAATGAAAADARLSLKAASHRSTLCDAATALLRLSSLAQRGGVASPQAAEAAAGGAGAAAPLAALDAAQELAWQLCDALGAAQALLARQGRFVKACLAELSQLQQELSSLATEQGGASVPAAGGGAAAEGLEEAAGELREALRDGVLYCLRWLYGLELPGLGDAGEWGADFECKVPAAEAAAAQLGSRDAVAAVWPLAEPLLLADLEHAARHKAFIQAAAAQFETPPGAAARVAAEWGALAAAPEPLVPCDEVDALERAGEEPMRFLLHLAAARAAGHAGQQQLGAEPQAEQQAERQAVGGAQQQGQGPMEVDGGEGDGVWDERCAPVYRSLYLLLAALQDEEPPIVQGGLLDPGSDAALDAALAPSKLDLCLNPRRLASWERLALLCHDAADALLVEASGELSSREWRHAPALAARVRRWRRLAYWATAGAWRCADTGEQRVRLLTCTGSRLADDSLRILPWRDPLAGGAEWAEAKAAAAPAFRQAERAFEAAEAAQELDGGAVEWDVLTSRARCSRKAGEPPCNWLPALARGAHAAAAADPAAGGVLMPLYALHAARARLLLGMPAASARGGGGDEAAAAPAGEEELLTLRMIGSYCFLPDSRAALSAAAGPSPAPAADLEPAARVLLADCAAAMRWCLAREPGFHRAAHRLAACLRQQGDPHGAAAVLAPFFCRGRQAFLPVMQPIQESREIGSRRGRGRPARRAGGGAAAAAAAAAEGGAAAAAAAGESAARGCTWGEAPERVAAVGYHEDLATFHTRLRKTTALYLGCLADAAAADAASARAASPAADGGQEGGRAPLEVLQAAAAHFAGQEAKAFDGFARLARGHLLLALLAGLRACCPMEAMEQAAAAEGPASAAPAEQAPPTTAQAVQQAPGVPGCPPSQQPLSPGDARGAVAAEATPAGGGTGAGAGSAWRGQPTPATSARHMAAARLLHAAGRLSGAAVSPWLAAAYQAHADLSHHGGAEDRWRSEALPSLQDALRLGCSGLAGGREIRRLCGDAQGGADALRRLFRLYASLHVSLLQHQGDSKRLLHLLTALRERMKGVTEARQARFLRRQVLGLADALLGTLGSALTALELEAAAQPHAPGGPSGSPPAATPLPSPGVASPPGADALGSPCGVESAETARLRERVGALLHLAAAFHKATRLRQAGGGGGEGLLAAAHGAEELLLRSFRVYSALAPPPVAAPPGASRADQLRAAGRAGEEVGKQQRRQSRQGARQGGGAAGGQRLAAIREEADGAGRKRGPPDDPRSARKRSRGASEEGGPVAGGQG